MYEAEVDLLESGLCNIRRQQVQRAAAESAAAAVLVVPRGPVPSRLCCTQTGSAARLDIQRTITKRQHNVCAPHQAPAPLLRVVAVQQQYPPDSHESRSHAASLSALLVHHKGAAMKQHCSASCCLECCAYCILYYSCDMRRSTGVDDDRQSAQDIIRIKLSL